MPDLDPAIAEILEVAASDPPPSLDDIAVARQAAVRRNARWNTATPAMAEIVDFEIDGPGGRVPIRLYRPQQAPRPVPVTIYLHGGGWVLGSIETHDGLCRRLAAAGGFAVASVGYRLAPEHPYPAGLQDAVAAIRWFASEASSLDGVPDRLAVAGDSAGAALALASALVLRDAGLPALRAVALLYGAYTANLDTASHRAFGAMQYGLTTETMSAFWQLYAGSNPDAADPLLMPVTADLRALPPLFVAAAEVDPLCEDSIMLAHRLLEAGANFDFRLWRGVVHGSLHWAERVPRMAGFIDEIAGFLSRALQRA